MKTFRRTLIVVPARMGSKRFPGKVLRPLGGRPVVEWCRRAAVRADCGRVVVATESRQVARAVERGGGEAVMTPASCRSGTDRAWSALVKLERAEDSRYAVVVNVQGDEPFISPSTIRKVARLAARSQIATAVVRAAPSAAGDPNVVKAVVAKDGRCLYFSRSAVPHANGGAAAVLQHIGIYGWSRAALRRFVRLKRSSLEKAERLEQLRALEAGMTIHAARVRGRTVAIDTPADLARARGLLRRARRGAR